MERVVGEMLQYVGLWTDEASGVLKVAAGQSTSAVVALLIDWAHRGKAGLDLHLLGIALAEACDCKNDDVMSLILQCWRGRCTATQAQPLLRAFAARGDASIVERLLSNGKMAMVEMDTNARAVLAGSGLSHVAGEGEARKRVLSTLLQAGADPRSLEGETALRNAARDRQAASMQLLLGVGTNVNAVDEDGKTVLCVAASSGCCETVQCLLEHGAHVRMRSHDGREPLDFAVDESVRQLLLAKVEELRMGLLDELLADEEADDKSGKSKKSKKDRGKKAAKVDGKASAAAAVAASEGAAVSSSADAAAEDDGAGVSKSAKKKQKKARAAAEAAALAGGASEATTLGEDDSLGPNDTSSTLPNVAAATQPPKSPHKKKGGLKGTNSPSSDKTGALPPSLLEAVGHVLRTQTTGPSMRLSSLVSALYDLSESFKEEIKNAGGAKTWLSIHSDEFLLDTDCAPGHESVTLRAPLPRPPAGAQPARSLLASPGPADCFSGIKSPDDEELHPLDRDAVRDAEAAHREAHQHGSALRAPMLPNGSNPHLRNGADSPPRLRNGDDLPEAQSCSLSGLGRAAADAADDAAAAALLGNASDTSDPLLIEKKIRAVQKKLRRVQTIEQLAGGDGTTLDSGQQARSASHACKIRH